MNQQLKHNMDITVIAAFLTKPFEFGRLECEIFIDIWFWLHGPALTVNSNLLQNANVKCDHPKHNSNCKWQTGSKVKTCKKNSLSTNLYAIKLILQLKQKIGIDLPKVTRENTRAVCADVTQMY